MSNLNGMNRKRADLEALARPDFSQLSVVQQSVVIQFVYHVSQSELGAPDWDIQLGKNPWQGANVVLVSMGEHNGTNPLPILHEIGNVGNDDIHAQQLGFREHHAGVDNNDVVAPAHRHAIHAEFAETAEGD